MKHKHEGCSNIHAAFSTFIGCTVKGVLFDTLPLGRRDLSSGTKTLIFDCGWGLTIASNGSYWPESPSDIERAISYAKTRLQSNREEIESVLALAGER